MASSETRREPIRTYISVGLISGSALALEFLFLRIFSTVQDHSATFSLISTALAGMGFGGAVAALWTRRSHAVTNRTAMGYAAMLMGLSIPLTLLILVVSPAVLFPHAMYAVIVPFLLAGFYLSMAFGLRDTTVNLLYLYDLAGASVGTVIATLMLTRIDPMHAVCWIGVLSFATSLLILPRCSTVMRGVGPLLLAGLIGLSFFWRPSIVPLGIKNNARPLFQELERSSENAQIVFTSHNLLGRLDLLEAPDRPFAFAYIDGAVPSWVYKASREPVVQRAMERMLPNFCFMWGERDSVLVIGAGGGLDVFLALRGGAKKITAVEINPLFHGILERYAEDNDRMAHSPHVSWHYQEGRRFVRDRGLHYDLILLSLVQLSSKRSYQEGHLGNYLYTLEAMREYWDHLDDNGRLVIVTHNDVFQKKLLATMYRFLSSRGISADDAMERIIALRVNPEEKFFKLYSHLVLLTKSPLSQPEVQHARDAAIKHGNELYHFPGGPYSDILVDASSSDMAAAVSNNAPDDIRPTSDRHPTFFNLELRSPDYLIAGLTNAIAVLLAVFLYIFLIFGQRQAKKGSLRFFLLYFILIGIGFVSVELTWINRLIVFIGHPTANCFLIITVILLSAGAGSYAAWRLVGENQQRVIGKALVALFVLLLATGLTLDSVLAFLDELAFAARMALATLLIAPGGFLLGMLFPAGLTIVKRISASDIPYFWTVNALAMVVGTHFSLLIHFRFGITASFMIFSVIYVILFTMLRLTGVLRSLDVIRTSDGV